MKLKTNYHSKRKNKSNNVSIIILNSISKRVVLYTALATICFIYWYVYLDTLLLLLDSTNSVFHEFISSFESLQWRTFFNFWTNITVPAFNFFGNAEYMSMSAYSGHTLNYYENSSK